MEDLEGQGDDANIQMTNMEVVTDRLLKGANDLHMKVCGVSWRVLISNSHHVRSAPSRRRW